MFQSNQSYGVTSFCHLINIIFMKCYIEHNGYSSVMYQYLCGVVNVLNTVLSYFTMTNSIYLIYNIIRMLLTIKMKTLHVFVLCWSVLVILHFSVFRVDLIKISNTVICQFLIYSVIIIVMYNINMAMKSLEQSN